MRKSIALIMAVMMMLLVAACGKTTPTDPQPGDQPGGSGKEAVFQGAWPYQPMPTGHFNTYVTNNLSMGIYWELMEMPLAMYYWADDTWMPLMATSWETKDNQFIVKLREGAKWSDGSEFTSQDVVDTFEVGKFFNWVVFRYVDKVEATDKNTVVFNMHKPSSLVERYVLKEKIRASSVYGEFAKKIADINAKDPERKSDEYKQVRAEFEQFRPAELVVTGPFKYDNSLINEAQATLIKNPSAWNADVVKIDKIVVYNGETPAVTPLVLAGQVDYATHGFPAATELQFVSAGIPLKRPPTWGGSGVMFNHRIYPLGRVEVRQAIAHLVDRNDNAKISLADSGKGVKYLTGFSDNAVDQWLKPEDKAKLNLYEVDEKKAADLLTSIGFTKGADGIWVDDKGKKMEYEILFQSEFANVAATAEHFAGVLTKFGIKVTPRGITHTQMPTNYGESQYEIATVSWGAGNPHPHFAYTLPMLTYNIQAANGVGMGFDMKQTTKIVGDVDFEQLIIESAEGFDVERQKEMVTKLALAYNELVPFITLVERYGNNPALETRVTGWPADSDPIWKNAAYGDNPATMLILEGRLKGK